MDEAKKGFIKQLGGIAFKKVSENTYEFSGEVKELHLNTSGIAHGGYVSTIADAGMGTAGPYGSFGKKVCNYKLGYKIYFSR